LLRKTSSICKRVTKLSIFLFCYKSYTTEQKKNKQNKKMSSCGRLERPDERVAMEAMCVRGLFTGLVEASDGKLEVGPVHPQLPMLAAMCAHRLLVVLLTETKGLFRISADFIGGRLHVQCRPDAAAIQARLTAEHAEMGPPLTPPPRVVVSHKRRIHVVVHGGIQKSRHPPRRPSAPAAAPILDAYVAKLKGHFHGAAGGCVIPQVVGDSAAPSFKSAMIVLARCVSDFLASAPLGFIVSASSADECIAFAPL
jgi:hypothetical protein